MKIPKILAIPILIIGAVATVKAVQWSEKRKLERQPVKDEFVRSKG